MLHLSCVVDAFPMNVSYHWTHNDKLLRTASGALLHHRMRPGAGENAIGTYTCQVVHFCCAKNESWLIYKSFTTTSTGQEHSWGRSSVFSDSQWTGGSSGGWNRLHISHVWRRSSDSRIGDHNCQYGCMQVGEIFQTEHPTHTDVIFFRRHSAAKFGTTVISTVRHTEEQPPIKGYVLQKSKTFEF